MSLLQNSNAIESGGYNINNSLRLRKSATGYLNRTFATPTSSTTWTVSLWFKRGEISSAHSCLFTTSLTDNFIRFQTGTDILQYAWANGSTVQSTAVFRDPSAWYHLVVAVDTTQATSSNRIRMYINGSEIAYGTSTYPALNATTLFNTARAHYLSFTSVQFDGYVAEVNWIDGQQLTPSSFGETDTTTGVWKPKAYTGTYGTNGFYLKFSDIATTSGSNAGLGKDFSGNSNYWTTNNISVTSGSTYDAMTDSPTLGASASNYCTLNPLAKSTSVTLSQANLTATGSAVSNNRPFTGTQKIFNGCYWEMTITSYATNSARSPVGVVQIPFSPSTFADDTLNASSGGGVDNVQLDPGGNTGTNPGIWQNGTKVVAIPGLVHAAGDIYMFAYNNGSIWVGKNGTWYNSGDPSAGTGACATGMNGEAVPIAYCYNATVWNANFGQRPFEYTPPTGFVGLNTYNLPDSTIKKGNSYMDATTYTGTGASLSITNAAGFRPDFVWVKGRSGATNHALYDAVRGTTNDLVANSDAAATTQAQGLTAFNSNGFTVGTLAKMNTNAATYVGWQWQAGSSTVTNTDGTISSQVCANTTTGFSIVTYTGNGSSSATVGHSLGVTPSMIIVKQRNGIENWFVYHKSLSANTYLQLNTTIAATSTTSGPNGAISTSPTSTTFGFTSGTTGVGNVNLNAATYVAYCWAEIAGFSKFGSYTGNGSTNGTFVYLGFRPKYVLIKATSGTTNNWNIMDSSRNTYNITNLELDANSSSAEQTGTSTTMAYMDFLSNGFKMRTTSAGGNGSSTTYIYAAFAENPFKNALAR